MHRYGSDVLERQWMLSLCKHAFSLKCESVLLPWNNIVQVADGKVATEQTWTVFFETKIKKKSYFKNIEFKLSLFLIVTYVYKNLFMIGPPLQQKFTCLHNWNQTIKQGITWPFSNIPELSIKYYSFHRLLIFPPKPPPFPTTITNSSRLSRVSLASPKIHLYRRITVFQWINTKPLTIRCIKTDLKLYDGEFTTFALLSPHCNHPFNFFFICFSCITKSKYSVLCSL